MHIVQQKLLDLATTTNLGSLKLREIGEIVGEPHPQKIKHHITQLFKKGFLKQNSDKSVITPVISNSQNDLFVSLPILGAANCGQALTIADEYYEGYLQISKSLLPGHNINEYFVVRAIGNSMNRSQINGRSLEDGDYAVINKSTRSSYDKKYVLSIINGMANIKKLITDQGNQQIALISESTQAYPPIYIHSQDFEDYLINGEVVAVIKKPLVSI